MQSLSGSSLYLFACVPPEIATRIAADRLGEAHAMRSIVARHRLHVTILNLRRPGMAQETMIALTHAAMQGGPPPAFRMAFDQRVVSPGQLLLTASDTLAGVRDCQHRLRERFRALRLDLPHEALPPPHVTLGYRPRQAPHSRAIDCISWTVTELVLVRSHYGQTMHDYLARWPLPPRPETPPAESDDPARLALA